jgi:hypothetical protein
MFKRGRAAGQYSIYSEMGMGVRKMLKMRDTYVCTGEQFLLVGSGFPISLLLVRYQDKNSTDNMVIGEFRM